MKFSIEAKAVVALEHNEGDKMPQLLSSSVNLEVSKELDRSMYVGEDGLPTSAGVKAVTQTLLHGLATNIQYAHEKGYWNEVEHIKFAVAELSRAFAEPTPTTFVAESVPVVEPLIEEIPTVHEAVAEVPVQESDSQAVTEPLPEQPYVFGNHDCQFSRNINQEYPRKCLKCGTVEGTSPSPTQEI